MTVTNEPTSTIKHGSDERADTWRPRQHGYRMELERLTCI